MSAFATAPIAAPRAAESLTLRSGFLGRACTNSAPANRPKAAAAPTFHCEASAEASSSRRSFISSSVVGLLALGFLPASAHATPASDYRPDQLERLARVVPEIRDIMPGFESDIKGLLAEKDYKTVRRRLRTLDRTVRMRLQNEVGNELVSDDRQNASAAMDKLREHLFRLDERAKEGDERGAEAQLASLLSDVETYLRTIPAAAGGSILPAEL